MRFIVIRFLTFADMIALKPSTCMVIKGIIATSETTPNASDRTLPSPASDAHAPIAMGRIKLDVKGPLATPPESKAMPVYNFGTKNDSPSEIR